MLRQAENTVTAKFSRKVKFTKRARPAAIRRGHTGFAQPFNRI